MSRMKIRDRDSGATVPFKLWPAQRKMAAAVDRAVRAGKLPWFLLCKSRRVGGSSFFDALGFCHCLSMPNATGLILAHQAQSSKKLFKIPLGLAACFPYKLDCTKTSIIFNNPQGKSELEIATAGSPEAGRGYTLSFLHVSEAAFISSDASFLSLLPAVSHNPNSIIVIESTANGKIGPGKAFYDLWMNSVEGKSEFIPIFVGWLEDPTCVRDPMEAADAPVNDEEQDLIENFGATKAQLAWRRFTLETFCQGYLNKFLQEYPHAWKVSFTSTGSPAFDRSELTACNETKRRPRYRCFIERDGTGGITLRRDNTRGTLAVWQDPVPEHAYYIGADAARGEEYGDFAAFCVWDGTTGEQVARLMDRIPPEVLAFQLDAIGRRYNNAMVNVELTGNLGLESQRRLRDEYFYPNLYGWKGKDDRRTSTNKRVAIGWETTTRTRDLMLTYFRSGLREGRVIVYDEVLIGQMEQCEMDLGFRWTIEKGHDDLLVASMLAWASCVQYPPPTVIERRKVTLAPEDNPEYGLDSTLDIGGTGLISIGGTNRIKIGDVVALDDPLYALKNHYLKMQKLIKKKKTRVNLVGV
jgi:hypothetical protein